MAIIAVSGKINSGKDIVGKIIQYLNSGETNVSFQQWIENPQLQYLSSWRIKKFASKVKEITALILGCTLADLEDRKFKESYLPSEWDYYTVKGRKDGFGYTSSEIFNTEADALWHGNEMYDYSVEAIRNRRTVREFMQLLATEGGRRILHPNIWVNSLLSEYKPLHTSQVVLFDFAGKEPMTPLSPEFHIYPNWVITDLRFKNELEALKKKDAVTIRINRFCYDSLEDFLVCHPDKNVSSKAVNIVSSFGDYVDYRDIEKRLMREIPEAKNYIPLSSQHTSEKELDDAKFDYVIDNKGSIEDLIESVKKVLDSYEEKNNN